MAEVLRETREAVDLSTIGIDSLRPKRAATGALILEVPGEGGAEKADKLAEAIRAATEGKGVAISRPVKTEEIRIAGLDESVTPAEVVAAVATVGGCSDVAVKATVRPTTRGLATAWVRCPTAAAKRVANAGRLKVGWVSARVEVLQPRQLQCFRCLEVGHTRARCAGEVDRSGRCYRCGAVGHQAGTCTAPPECPLCKDQGRPAGHRYGGGACPMLRAKKGNKGRKAAGGQRPPAIENAPPADKGAGQTPEEAMDTAE